MGIGDRRQRQRKRETQCRQEIREALGRVETVEDLIELVEREVEQQVEDELTGETRTVTQIEHSSPRLQTFETVCENEPVQREKVSGETLNAADDAYSNGDALTLARLAFEVATGFDPKNDTPPGN